MSYQYQEYPKAMYRSDEVTTVRSVEEEAALGADWEDGPTHFASKPAKASPIPEAKPKK